MRRPFYHLTREDREVIFEGIVSGKALKDIASSLDKCPTSISREVKRGRNPAPKNTRVRSNICIHAKTCELKKLCRFDCPRKRCAECKTKVCAYFCPNFSERVCAHLKRWPYVCTKCKNRGKCGLVQYLYRPSIAHAKSVKLKTESRNAISLDSEQLATLDALVSPLLKNNKQSVEVICATHPHIPVSAQTLRRYLDAGHTQAIRLDLLSAPSRKIRKVKKNRQSRHSSDGRSFVDFNSLSKKRINATWEVDTLFGSAKDKSCLLTLVNRQSLLLLAFKIDACSTQNVCGVFDYLELLCIDAGTNMSEVFRTTLYDNGSEFSDVEGMESSHIDESVRTCAYFCDPYSSWQKPHVENRHLMIRRILPKGSQLDSIKHNDISKMLSHINSYPALSREGSKTPYELALETMPEELLGLLGIYLLPIGQVSLTRNLLDK